MGSVIYLLTVVVASILIFEFKPLLAQLIFVAAIMLFIVVLCLFPSRFSSVRDKPCYFLKEITLSPDGIVEINNNSYRMHLNSRMGFLGCWLCLTNEKSDKVKTNTLFIFKSSVSQQHYSQLCRVIKRNTFDHSRA
ncbi:hypothetical protein ACPUVO_06270 [Pseudocolwellia sp. HL-MZ19]|uniref:hypothetical protein n=1 Tax=unclassified Pseudocolwellia TaxID=2848178 RepID=UPI003CEB35A4